MFDDWECLPEYQNGPLMDRTVRFTIHHPEGSMEHIGFVAKDNPMSEKVAVEFEYMGKTKTRHIKRRRVEEIQLP